MVFPSGLATCPPFSSSLMLSSGGLVGVLPLAREDTGQSGRGSQQGPTLSAVCQSICEGPTAQQGLVGGCGVRSCLLGLVLKRTQ